MAQVPSFESLLEFAVDAATSAGRITLEYFGRGIEAEWKADASPVTIADRQAEQHLRRLIEARYPGHGIVGEEYGASSGDSPCRWILDPIDGTRAFVQGVPLYGVLIGLEISGEPAVGVAHFPALGETLAAATGLGCRANGRPARVSSVANLADATVVYTDGRDLERRRPGAWARIKQATRQQRGWGDCYGHCLVATGRADIALDPLMHLWDSAALLPIVREAGGRFTDWSGRATIHGGHAVSTNRALFEQVMALIGTTDG
jgi:histidinol phosphatase-like enzyme (inositol monophosphatase family)